MTAAVAAIPKPPSVKLTKDARAAILKDLIRDKFVAELDAIYKRAGVLAVQCYEERYTPHQRKQLKDLPAGWVPMHDKIYIKILGNNDTFGLHFNGLSRFLPWHPKGDAAYPNISLPTPQCDVSQSLELPKTSRLAKEFFAIQIAAEGIEEKRKKLTREIDGVLWSVNTNKQLLEAWPEIKEFIVKHVPLPTPVQTLPVKVLTNLNKELGLVKAA